MELQLDKITQQTFRKIVAYGTTVSVIKLPAGLQIHDRFLKQPHSS